MFNILYYLMLLSESHEWSKTFWSKRIVELFLSFQYFLTNVFDWEPFFLSGTNLCELIIGEL